MALTAASMIGLLNANTMAKIDLRYLSEAYSSYNFPTLRFGKAGKELYLFQVLSVNFLDSSYSGTEKRFGMLKFQASSTLDQSV